MDTVQHILEVAFYIPNIPPKEPRDYFAYFWWALGFILLLYNFSSFFKSFFIPLKYSDQEQSIPKRKIKKSLLDKWNSYK